MASQLDLVNVEAKASLEKPHYHKLSDRELLKLGNEPEALYQRYVGA
jgi:hypothetical protein